MIRILDKRFALTAHGTTVKTEIVAGVTTMIGGLREVAWDDPTESIPAFLTLIMMPLAVSITEGVAFGLVAYAVLKLASGRPRELHPLIYVFALLFLGRYIFVR